MIPEELKNLEVFRTHDSSGVYHKEKVGDSQRIIYCDGAYKKDTKFFDSEGFLALGVLKADYSFGHYSYDFLLVEWLTKKEFRDYVRNFYIKSLL